MSDLKEKDDPNKPCLKCTLKHSMNAKTFLLEAKQFGFETVVELEELNDIIRELCNYIIQRRG